MTDTSTHQEIRNIVASFKVYMDDIEKQSERLIEKGIKSAAPKCRSSAMSLQTACGVLRKTVQTHSNNMPTKSRKNKENVAPITDEDMQTPLDKVAIIASTMPEPTLVTESLIPQQEVVSEAAAIKPKTVHKSRKAKKKASE